MNDDIIIAIIGAVGAIIVAWITVSYKTKKSHKDNPSSQDNISGNKVAGDVVEGDKAESHVHIEGGEPEKKNKIVYLIEVLFVFVFTGAVSGAIFGSIGFLIAQEVGAIIGGVLGIIPGFVNAGSIKRTKGI